MSANDYEVWRNGKEYEVLDHGYVRFVEGWGSDERIIEAARMSTSKGFQGWGPTHSDGCIAGMELTTHGDPDKKYGVCTCTPKAGDEKLLRYLWEHKHHTPFEMAGMTLEVQAPIFVFREWHRHRTQSYNELSSRYTALPDLFYVPSIRRLMTGGQSQTNKQAAGEVWCSQGEAADYQSTFEQRYATMRKWYEEMLADGLARELARLVVPVAQYSRMRASANLRNWLAFLTLRMDKGAQWEIRQYANAVADIVATRFPRTFELFAEERA